MKSKEFRTLGELLVQEDRLTILVRYRWTIEQAMVEYELTFDKVAALLKDLRAFTKRLED